MQLSLQRLSRPLRRLALAGLAAGAFALGTADNASAQRAPVGKAWSTGFSSPQQSCPPTGRRIDTRSPRGFRGGHYETRYERVWVPGTTRQEWHAAEYGFRYDPCGRRVRFLVRAGHYDTVRIPGRYEQRAVQVWVPARRTRVVEPQRRTRRVSHIGRRYR